MTPAYVLDIGQILFADIILSGDNALIIAMAAASLPPALRQRAIYAGLALAALVRVAFAALASYLIALPGMLLIGGFLLSWVCWRFYRDLRQGAVRERGGEDQSLPPGRGFFGALLTIALADASMSLDNIVAIAAIARDDTMLLMLGIGLSIAFMAFFANLIMRLMTRFRWLSWAGFAFLVYLTARLLYDGWEQIAPFLVI